MLTSSTFFDTVLTIGMHFTSKTDEIIVEGLYYPLLYLVFRKSLPQIFVIIPNLNFASFSGVTSFETDPAPKSGVGITLFVSV